MLPARLPPDAIVDQPAAWSGMAHDRPSRPRPNTNDSADVDLKLSRMADSRDHRYSSPDGEFHDGPKSYVSPSVQDEYNDEERPTRMPSPPMSETSNPPSMEQQTVLSDEVIAHLTERITKEGEFGPMVCKLRRATNPLCQLLNILSTRAISTLSQNTPRLK